MSAVETESARARPLSGGLWTLFSWLRRDAGSSSESLSSVGSDRTAASFAFLAPPHYAASHGPLVVPPPPPPTDSYKKRVRDRNLRRHHDRDITLLRKYGLRGFDAFSLPSARLAGGAERSRRAASELLQRRAHVPGKRRAPPPPAHPAAPATLPRSRAYKRPAPQPPLQVASAPKKTEEDIDTLLSNSDTLPMSSRRAPDKQPSKQSEVTMGCRSEKCSKKEKQHPEEVKPRQDRSFLKQIFDSRKRNSAIETSSVKLLPSISELDKQAHEIIERYKLKELEQNTQQGRLDNETPGSSKQVEAWICTRCLRKYNATVITCLYCLPLENALLNNSCKSSKVSNNATQTNSSPRSGLEDKEKLKEILKEMKDSLPKNPTAGPSKLKNNSLNETEYKSNSPKIVETATLRIDSSVSTEAKNASTAAVNHKLKLDKQTHSSDNTNDQTLATIENVLVTQPEVLVHTKDNIVIVNNNKTSKTVELNESKTTSKIVTRNVDKVNMTKTELASKLLNAENTSSSTSNNLKSDINTPMKVSSLFNPIYIPKNESVPIATSTTKTHIETNETQKVVAKLITASNITNDGDKPLISDQLHKDPVKLEQRKEKEHKQQSARENIVIVKKIVGSPVARAPVNSTTQSTTQEENIVDKLDQHSRRRNLINQLEQSIARGDERAAADAAVKLAQLRLSCSVLSFSSQIVAGPSTSIAETSSQKANECKEETSTASETRTVNAKSVTTTAVLEPVKINSVAANNNYLNGSNNTAVEKQAINEQIQLPFVTVSEAKPKTVLALSKTTHKKDAAVQSPPRCAPSTSKDFNVKKDTSEEVPIHVWVEDKETTRGPVQIHVRRSARMGELRLQAERALGLAARMQRWIVGRALCSHDDTPLVELAGPDLSAPFYLCLVESETKEPIKPDDVVKPNEGAGNVYNDLVKLEQQAFVANAETFECGVCMEECSPAGGVVLRECVHSFCKACLSDVVRHSDEPVVTCPATGCPGVLQEREIKGLVSAEEYEKWLARGLAVAESGTRNAFHCRTRDCSGWALCEPGVRRFPCPVCKHTNCVQCQTIHEGETCEQHRAKLGESASTNNASDQTDEGTRALLDSLIARGEALECPECSAIITKKWGCDWIKCSACKTEICWVTRGRRWGPAGRGDTSAGCRCGTDGKKCHPSCGYCH